MTLYIEIVSYLMLVICGVQEMFSTTVSFKFQNILQHTVQTDYTALFSILKFYIKSIIIHIYICTHVYLYLPICLIYT